MTNKNIQSFSDLPPIIAVDFDGTLVTDKYPEIGNERLHFCAMVRKLQKLGIKSILWTSRTGKALDEAIKWCEENDLHFDTINTNIPEVIEFAGTDTRKVYADVYFDDKNQSASPERTMSIVREIWSCLGK